jgi:ATP-dependent Clp protease ATP-binding subunit ClpA
LRIIPLNRLIQNTILNKIANMIIGSEVKAGDTIVIDFKNGDLVYEVKSKRARKAIDYAKMLVRG